MEHICSLKSFQYCLRIYNIQSLNIAKFSRIQLFVTTESLLSTRTTSDCYWGRLRLTHTLLQRTLYSKGTLCIVTSCSKEQLASNWLVTVCSLTHFTPQHTLPPGVFSSPAHFAPQHIMLLGIHLTIMWNRRMKQDSDLNFRVKM